MELDSNAAACSSSNPRIDEAHGQACDGGGAGV